ncbi:MAG TPA: DUF3048 domain-containing protein [Candidatus Saccharimonadales bacterium]|nr:DUF3048 domain-containing protein [Candidatus Saccharimonadales bacterium]
MSSPLSWLAGLSRRGQIVLGLVVIMALAVVAIAGVTAYRDLNSPTQVSFNLRSGSSEVGLHQSLTFTFSRAVSPSRVKAGLRISPAAEGSFKNSNQRVYTWTPSTGWQDLTTYSVRMAPGKDASGHSVAAGAWRFTTTIQPRVTALVTQSGASVGDGGQIPLGSALSVQFNEALAQSSVSILVNGAAAALTWASDGKSAGFSLGSLKAGPISFKLAPGAHDAAGRAAAAWSLAARLVFQVTVHTLPLTYPAVIQVPNDANAWDQSGLQSASVVFQYLAEGGITRMSAIFSNIPDVVGPIRSGRLISFQLTQHYGGRLFLSGLSQPEFAVLHSNPFPTWFESNGQMFRSPSRQAPDNLYIEGQAVQHVEQTNPVTASTIQKSDAVPITSGPQVSSFSVAEHQSSYTYDPVTGTYEKTQENHLMSDASLNQPLRIQMVIVLHTTETVEPNMVDVNGAHSLNFDLQSSGPVEFYYGGLSASGQWASVGANQPLKFTLSNGQAVPFPPGLVWVDVVSR